MATLGNGRAPPDVAGIRSDKTGVGFRDIPTAQTVSGEPMYLSHIQVRRIFLQVLWSAVMMSFFFKPAVNAACLGCCLVGDSDAAT